MAFLKCTACGHYTLQEACASCGGKAIEPGPAKYSPEDHYGKYRRMAKEQAGQRTRGAAR
jgi:H/ACA ribonucleoprotein complex subunit 3